MSDLNLELLTKDQKADIIKKLIASLSEPSHTPAPQTTRKSTRQTTKSSPVKAAQDSQADYNSDEIDSCIQEIRNQSKGASPRNKTQTKTQKKTPAKRGKQTLNDDPKPDPKPKRKRTSTKTQETKNTTHEMDLGLKLAPHMDLTLSDSDDDNHATLRYIKDQPPKGDSSDDDVLRQKKQTMKLDSDSDDPETQSIVLPPLSATTSNKFVQDVQRQIKTLQTVLKNYTNLDELPSTSRAHTDTYESTKNFKKESNIDNLLKQSASMTFKPPANSASATSDDIVDLLNNPERIISVRNLVPYKKYVVNDIIRDQDGFRKKTIGYLTDPASPEQDIRIYMPTLINNLPEQKIEGIRKAITNGKKMTFSFLKIHEMPSKWQKGKTYEKIEYKFESA